MNGCYNTMGIDRVRGSAGVAGCVLAVAAAFAPGLAAQGAKEANGRGRPSATVAGPSSHLQPARGILGDLVGTWQFQIWFAGNFSGTPDVSGIRVMKALFDDLRLEWTEVLDHSQVQGQGDRKSTRLNSSHLVISYAVFCLKKKKKLHAIRCMTRVA